MHTLGHRSVSRVCAILSLFERKTGVNTERSNRPNLGLTPSCAQRENDRPSIGGPTTHFNRVECVALLGKTKTRFSLWQDVGFMVGVFGNLGLTSP